MLRDAYADQLACLKQANDSVAPIDGRVYDLAQNWHPSGYYEPGAIRQGVASVQAVLSSAFDILAQANHQCTLAPGCEFPTWADDYRRLLASNNQAGNYLDAAAQAESSAAAVLKTPYVEANGFKTWALDALQAASGALVDASVISCLMPWWASAIANFLQVVDNAANVLGSILGVGADIVKGAYQAGQAVTQVAVEGFSLLKWTTSNFPIVVGLAVLFFGGRYIWRNRDRLKALS